MNSTKTSSEKIKPAQKQLKKDKWTIKEFLFSTIITLIIVLPFRVYVARPFIVNGSSMYPTFETGQYLIVDQITYNFSKPARGDVIVFHFPKNTKRFFIKRIIGLPGESIEIDGEKVYITPTGGKKFLLEEPYIKFGKENHLFKELGETEYFVMGDNRADSLDSRVWGAVGKEYLVGRALFRLLPIQKSDRFLPGKFNF